MEKPKFIEQIENKNSFFSILKSEKIEGDLIKFLSSKKLNKVFEISEINFDGKMKTEEIIFESQQKFYLHIINLKKDELVYNLTIYFESSQFNELYIFATQLLKQYKKWNNLQQNN